MISLDFWGLLSQSCWFQPDFLKQLVFTTLLPLGIVGVLAANYAKTIKWEKRELEERETRDERERDYDVYFWCTTSTCLVQTDKQANIRGDDGRNSQLCVIDCWYIILHDTLPTKPNAASGLLMGGSGTWSSRGWETSIYSVYTLYRGWGTRE